MTETFDPFDMELTPDLVIRAYQAGIFPMSESEKHLDVFWVSPEQRGIIPLDGFKISKSLRKALKNHGFTIKVDTDFQGVIEGCSHAGTDRDSTWISPTIINVYAQLFERNICHTVEVWADNELVGGLYGLSLGGAFFGESMFHRRTNASKIALAHLVQRLRAGHYTLLDTQFISNHLASLGAIEIERSDYEKRLHAALMHDGDFNRVDNLPRDLLARYSS